MGQTRFVQHEGVFPAAAASPAADNSPNIAARATHESRRSERRQPMTAPEITHLASYL
jgi:hypothetical protein